MSSDAPNNFPDPRYFPGVDGIVFVGGDLEVETLLSAYRLGIFPWPVEGYPLLWHCPEERGILEFRTLHVSKSLEKLAKREPYRITFNRAFERVIQACAEQPRRGQDGTWIWPSFIPSYTKFHEAGWAHSIEAWEGSELVGGLYGVFVDGLFCGESMFHRRPSAGKLCLLRLIRALESQGITWMDIQMVTPATKSFGGRYIPRADFLRRLHALKAKGKPKITFDYER